ncbi:MAG: class I SAM-dependent methyltransferase [Stappiaceae bacterium]
MTDEAIYCDPDLAQFYDWENPWPQDFDYFARLANGSKHILDLGCGTGIFSAELAARGHRVTGVDPAAAMLDIARSRRGGEAVKWIEADARTLEMDQRFDMVLMTGHAFQTLLTHKDRSATVRAIARHLLPGGKFFFDSRNPEFREWDKWTPENTRATRHHPDHGLVEHWKDAQFNEADGVVTYGTFYRLESGKLISGYSQIAFAAKDEIAQLLEQAGLSVDRWIGDYVGGEFGSGSPEIIPLGKR